tara:strand:+ start:56 stop:160 length:105 start_codon:yes stop_codon:yes gene_type:complete
VVVEVDENVQVDFLILKMELVVELVDLEKVEMFL